MFTYDIQDTSVIVGGNEVQFPEKVKKSIELDDTLIVLLNTVGRNNIPDNVWAINEAGDIEWKIEPLESEKPYTGLWQEDGELWVYNWGGFDFHIDKQNGQIITGNFVK